MFFKADNRIGWFCGGSTFSVSAEQMEISLFPRTKHAKIRLTSENEPFNRVEMDDSLGRLGWFFSFTGETNAGTFHVSRVLRAPPKTFRHKPKKKKVKKRETHLPEKQTFLPHLPSICQTGQSCRRRNSFRACSYSCVIRARRWCCVKWDCIPSTRRWASASPAIWSWPAGTWPCRSAAWIRTSDSRAWRPSAASSSTTSRPTNATGSESHVASSVHFPRYRRVEMSREMPREMSRETHTLLDETRSDSSHLLGVKHSPEVGPHFHPWLYLLASYRANAYQKTIALKLALITTLTALRAWSLAYSVCSVVVELAEMPRKFRIRSETFFRVFFRRFEGILEAVVVKIVTPKERPITAQ